MTPEGALKRHSMSFGGHVGARCSHKKDAYLQADRTEIGAYHLFAGGAFKAATLDRSVTPPGAWLSHIGFPQWR
jgi:hypothetical protein